MNIIRVQDSPHWATNLIGKPWRPEWHCWGLVRQVYREQLSVELPEFPTVDPRNVEAFGRAIHAGALSADWAQIGAPEEFAVVAMSRKNLFHHVGIWTEADGGLIVHAQDGSCTVADSLPYLRQNGWKRIGFFRYGAFCRDSKPV